MGYLESKFRFVSLGIVAADKPINTWEIEVYPTELYPNVVGDGGDLSATVKISSNLKDPDDVELTSEVTKANTITATWLPTQNNRATAPDVCKGETVRLYQYGGNDQYYWELVDLQPNYRKKETVVYYYSNQDKIDTESDDLLSKGYYLKVDTNNKQIQLHTSTNNNEEVGYDIIIDTANSKISIKDTKENSIELDSAKGDLNINTKNNVNVTTKEKVVMNFKGIELHNSSDELITLLGDLMDAIIGEQHMGNMGGPTMLSSDSIKKYQQIKQKLSKFKG